MTAQNDLNNSSSSKSPTDSNLRGSSHGKETEKASAKGEILQGSSENIEISRELKNAGVEEIRGSIELPPDIKKLGVTQTGFQAPPSQQTPSVAVSLPMSDDKILKGLNAPISSALKWLSVWCLKRLKSAHLILKLIHGKIIRVKDR